MGPAGKRSLREQTRETPPAGRLAMTSGSVKAARSRSLLLARSRFVVFALSFILTAAGAAWSCPNDGGTIALHDAGLLYSATNGSYSMCGQGVIPATCADIDTRLDLPLGGRLDKAIFKVYAVFREGSSPRLIGLTFGIDYDSGIVQLPLYGKCGDFEMCDADWPAPRTGTTVTWNVVQTSYLVPVYWFAAYSYMDPPPPTLIRLTGNLAQGGGYFGDDSVGCDLTPIAGYGTLGLGTDGSVPCPSSGVEEQAFEPPVPPLRALPNPMTSSTWLVYAAQRGGDASLGVFDAGGRLVRTLGARSGAEGMQRSYWDGRDAAGRPVPAGAYSVRLSSDEGNASCTVIILR
jgi:hypothetical protein